MPTQLPVGLNALRAISYDWTMHLRSVWSDPPFDSGAIHTPLRAEFQERLDLLKQEQSINSPLGWLVVGAAGSGKTHWLSICRQQAVAKQIAFVLVDMTDVRDFWNTVLQGYLDSLQQAYAKGKYQQRVLLERFLSLFKIGVPVEQALQMLADSKDRMVKAILMIVEGIHKQHPKEAKFHQDAIRAVLATVSKDLAILNAGLSWLNANQVDDDMRKLLGFTKPQEEPRRIVQSLSWMMSLCGPTVVALDQLDPIVAQLDPAAKAEGYEPSAENLQSLSIIQGIANGLGALRDTTFRTLAVVSCLESTLTAIRRHAVSSWQDRYEDDVRKLVSLSNADAAASMLSPRTEAGCRSVGFTPPYPTWPVSPQALQRVGGQSPRQLLKLCEAHRRACLATGAVREMTALTPTEPPPRLPPEETTLDAQFASLRSAADIAKILDEATGDERIAPLLNAGCRCLLHEMELPESLDAIVDDFPGGKTTKPLHARIRLVDHNANDREEHYSFRALQQTNARAFQARIKGVMNGSGIDKRLPFRHCVVLRNQAHPGGVITQQLIQQYQDSGGQWHEPSHEEVRTLHALKELVAANPPGLEDWLKRQRPVSQLPLFKQACKRLIGFGMKSPATTAPETSKRTEVLVDDFSQERIFQARIPLGKRQLGNKSETVYLPLPLLAKHTVVLAGNGSGKTVLLKRIIEEAALAGIPSIVVDGANDLAELGFTRSEPAPEWGPDDPAKAKDFHANTDIVYWTPGRDSGNALVFEPLPDLAAVAADPEELQLAVDAATEAIAALVNVGKGDAANKKRGILAKSLRFFATQGPGDLRDFIALLNDLPPEACLRIDREAKLAKEMADSLLAKIETNPMLRSVGTGLDPAVLFGDAKRLSAGPRISIISLVGLATDELKQQFVYQLGMTLFAWIKRNPSPPGRALRGLLVVDEARDFIPSKGSVPSKTSLQLLASQARKYHLGLVLATQMPKEVENKVIGNCATHFYGRASSPAAIQTIKDQIKERGGKGDDIATLKAGQFYVYNSEADLPKPVLLQTSMCLAPHKMALQVETIVERAAQSRKRLAQAK